MDAGQTDVLPVVDADGHLVGLLTRAIVDAAQRPSRALVEDAMDRTVACCRPSDSLSDVDATIHQQAQKHVPIIDETGVLCGLVSTHDLSWLRPPRRRN